MHNHVAFKALLEGPSIVALRSKHDALQLLLFVAMVSQEVMALAWEMSATMLLCLGSGNVVWAV